jgi:hypothetical protein
MPALRGFGTSGRQSRFLVVMLLRRGHGHEEVVHLIFQGPPTRERGDGKAGAADSGVFSDLDDSGSAAATLLRLLSSAGGRRAERCEWLGNALSAGGECLGMRERGFRVLVDVRGDRIEAGFHAPSTEKPVLIALRLREEGWDPYRVHFDALLGAWIAFVLNDSRRAGVR